MISAVVKLESVNELKISLRQPERVEVTYDVAGHLQALSWKYETADGGLHAMVKRRGGEWDRRAGGWTFRDSQSAQEMLDAIVKRHPDWPVIGHPDEPFQALAGISISRLRLEDGFEACLIPAPLPFFAHVAGTALVFRLAGGKSEIGLLLGNPNEISTAVDSMVKQGATCDNTLAEKWCLTTGGRKLQVKVTGWAVKITCVLSNPLHYLAAPEQKYRWEGTFPCGTKVAIPWTGANHTTRKLWPDLKRKLQAVGLKWEGDDPEAEPTVPAALAAFDERRVSGWESLAPNGHLLHAYQKEGARFCASRGMRALIGDEMGIGKTAQAIAAVEAVGAPRVLVICPANARYVWEREIQGWGGQGVIQHITSQLDKLDLSARWHILTYDLIATRTETWKFKDELELQAFIDAFPDLASEIKSNDGKQKQRQIALEKPLEKMPAFDAGRIAAWGKIMQRLRGELLGQILAAGPLLTILDEAHRAKNKEAKRTKAIKRIAACETTQLLMLTGTPLRNNEHEAAILLGLLDAEASTALSKEYGYTIQDVKDYLNHFMIRRTKAEVLTELPEKTRQRIDISNLDSEQVAVYHNAMASAQESYLNALRCGKSEAEARRSMQGGIELARTALGTAKAINEAVIDLVLDVVENKACCVIFCAHHLVSDSLKVQLEQEKMRVAVVDGRMQQKQRAAIVDEFQEGRLDVFIGGINSAGEAITLTRADTVIFVELDWVPAALLQAEDRIHRIGQRSNCQIIQLVAKMDGENLDEMMVDLIGSKIARIGSVLDEDGSNIITGGIQDQLHARLLQGVVAVAVVEAESVESDVGAVTMDLDAELPPTAEPAKDSMAVSVAPIVAKRGRGRPKVYLDQKRPTPTERSKKSIRALANAGGKRLMLRLTPEAHEALKVVMAMTGSAQETAAINQALVERKNELLRIFHAKIDQATSIPINGITFPPDSSTLK